MKNNEIIIIENGSLSKNIYKNCGSSIHFLGRQFLFKCTFSTQYVLEMRNKAMNQRILNRKG